ncbi:hypothetical protein ACQY1H_05335 [Agrobacterium vitis]|uniref:hypothetical protein n=1 Tax=Agrobacterium vitis TaxID=373 RepID=UPI003D28FDC8
MADNAGLKQIVLQAERPVFAVLDGAQFDDLPRSLFAADFIHKPLYLDRGNGTADQLRTAPQLVWLDRDWHDPDKDSTGQPRPTSERMLDCLFDLVGDRPAAVFWQCEAGGDVLFRHLRTINMILLPTSANMDRGKSYERNPLATPTDQPSDADHEMVLFRHADSNVMAQVLPSLTYAHLARVLGPAQQILYSADPDWSEKPMRASRAEDMPAPATGPLKLTVEEVREIEAKREIRSRRKIATYLKKVAPEQTTGMSEDELNRFVYDEERKVKAFGVRREDMIGRWAFMQITSKTDLSHDKNVRAAMTNPSLPETPDERIKILFDLRLRMLRENV